jgi:hypothetical protein
MPRPRLFDSPDATTGESEAKVVVEPTATAVTVVESKPSFVEVLPPEPVVAEVVAEVVADAVDDVIDDVIEEGADDSKSWVPFFDPDDDLGGMLDATGPMLRDAFRSRHNGRQRD